MKSDAAPADYDLAVAKATIAQARKERLKMLFAHALVENDPNRREKLLEQLGELVRDGSSD